MFEGAWIGCFSILPKWLSSKLSLSWTSFSTILYSFDEIFLSYSSIVLLKVDLSLLIFCNYYYLCKVSFKLSFNVGLIELLRRSTLPSSGSTIFLFLNFFSYNWLNFITLFPPLLPLLFLVEFDWFPCFRFSSLSLTLSSSRISWILLLSFFLLGRCRVVYLLLRRESWSRD